MAQDGMIGYGTTIGYGTVDSGVYVDLGKVTNIDGPGVDMDVIEFLCMDSSARTAEKYAGAKHFGQATVELVFTGTAAEENYENLFGMWGDVKDWEIAWPDTSKVEFEAVLASVSPSAPVDGEITCSATLEVTELPVFTPYTAA